MAKSALATRLSRQVLKADLSDPMSGFFMIRSDIVRRLAPDLAGIGFKILLDIMTGSPRPLKFREFGYVFRVARAGREQARSRGGDGISDRALRPHVRALRAGAVRHVLGDRLVGVAVHMAVLALCFLAIGTSFVAGQILAATAAMTGNFFLNNALTYRDRRLRGWRQLVDGWVSFCVVCSVGLVANVGVAAFVHDAQNGEWAVSALLGVLVGAVWNYALSSRFVWGRY